MPAIYQNIYTLLGTTQTQMSSARNAVRNLISSGFQCTQGVKLYDKFASSEKYMKKVQSAMISAYDSACTMAKNDGSTKSVNRAGNVTNLSYALSGAQKKNAMILLDYSAIDTQVNNLNTSRANLETALSRCKAIITSVNAAEYTVTLSSTLTLAGAMLAQAASAVGIAQQKKVFQAAKESTLSYLKTAKTNLTSLIAALKTLSQEISYTEQAFKDADTKVRKAVVNIKKAQALAESKKYTSGSSYSKSEMESEKERLEELQKEYTEVYGKESEEIAEEIVRLNRLLNPGSLNVDMDKANAAFAALNDGALLDQHSKTYNGSGNCCAVSYAFAVYLATGKAYNPKTFVDSNGSAQYTAKGVTLGGYTYYNDSKLETLTNQLNSGMPVMIHYFSPHTDQEWGHWVVLVGIDEDGDFLVFNPAGGNIEKMDSEATSIAYKTVSVSS